MPAEKRLAMKKDVVHNSAATVNEVGPKVDEFSFDQWKIRSKRFHILNSQCCCVGEEDQKCHFCVYSLELELPQWPEMIFPDNSFILSHSANPNVSISFEPLNALKLINAKESDESIKVASSEVWQGARGDSIANASVIKAFDWTFTTSYTGNYCGFREEATEKEINLEKLKEPEPILFFTELSLFEDELGDNGCTSLTLKARCMPSGMFIVLRLYMRVDDVMVRVIDTRLHWERGNSFIHREKTHREKRMTEMNDQEKQISLDPNMAWTILPSVKTQNHLLHFNNNNNSSS